MAPRCFVIDVRVCIKLYSFYFDGHGNLCKTRPLCEGVPGTAPGWLCISCCVQGFSTHQYRSTGRWTRVEPEKCSCMHVEHPNSDWRHKRRKTQNLITVILLPSITVCHPLKKRHET